MCNTIIDHGVKIRSLYHIFFMIDNGYIYKNEGLNCNYSAAQFFAERGSVKHIILRWKAVFIF